MTPEYRHKSRSAIIEPAYLKRKERNAAAIQLCGAFAERLSMDPKKQAAGILKKLISAHKRLVKGDKIPVAADFEKNDTIKSNVEFMMVNQWLDLITSEEAEVIRVQAELESHALPPDPVRMTLRAMCRGTYDLQQLRIEMGNRLCAAYRVKLGIKPGESEDDEDNIKAKEILDQLRASYKKLTDGVKRELPKKDDFKGDGIISTFTELCLIAEYIEIECNEDKHFGRLEEVLMDFPIYTEFLQHVEGCGRAMSAVIISEIDIRKARYVSSIWKYIGVHGPGVSRRAEDLKPVHYFDKDGHPAQRMGVEYNVWAKTKIVGVLSDCLLKQGIRWNPCSDEAWEAAPEENRGLKTKTIDGVKIKNVKCLITYTTEWGKIYGDYKNRLNNSERWKDREPGHRHRAALRYMIKMFCKPLYIKWRTLEGLPVHPSYQEAKLGHTHAA